LQLRAASVLQVLAYRDGSLIHKTYWCNIKDKSESNLGEVTEEWRYING